MTDTPTPSGQAFFHAENLAHATAELLRFAREGASTDRYPFGLDDITVDLAQALLFTARTEVAGLTEEDDATERDQAGQLCAALAKWLGDNGIEVPA